MKISIEKTKIGTIPREPLMRKLDNKDSSIEYVMEVKYLGETLECPFTTKVTNHEGEHNNGFP